MSRSLKSSLGILAVSLGIFAMLQFIEPGDMRGSLLDSATIEVQLKQRSDTNHDRQLSPTEVRSGIVKIIRGVYRGAADSDIDGSGVTDNADISAAVKAFKRLLKAVCGNGVLDAAEQCDDNNTASNDGCNALCSVEQEFTCTGEPSVCTPVVYEAMDFVADEAPASPPYTVAQTAFADFSTDGDLPLTFPDPNDTTGRVRLPVLSATATSGILKVAYHGDPAARVSLGTVVIDFPQPLDFSSANGFRFLHRYALAGASLYRNSFGVGIVFPSGANCTAQVYAPATPPTVWKEVLVPFNDPSTQFQLFSPSGTNSCDPQDWTQVTGLRFYFSTRYGDDAERNFELDDLRLVSREPYTGPRLLAAPVPVGTHLYEHPRGETALVRFTLSGGNVPAGQNATVNIRLLDMNGRVLEQSPNHAISAGSPVTYSVAGDGYREVRATLMIDGTAVWNIRRGFSFIDFFDPGVIQVNTAQVGSPVPKNPSADSVFGLLNGNVFFMRHWGYMWYRLFPKGPQLDESPNGPPAVGPLYNNPWVPLHYVIPPGMKLFLAFSEMPQRFSSCPASADYVKCLPNTEPLWQGYLDMLRWLSDTNEENIFWEVWNEPNGGYLKGATLDDIVDLHDRSYTALRGSDEAHPRRLLGPVPYNIDLHWIRAFLQASAQAAGQEFDEFATHFYPDRSPDDVGFMGMIDAIRDMLTQYGFVKADGQPVDMHITEAGYNRQDFSERDQAIFLVQTYLQALAKHVTSVVWFDGRYWRDIPLDPLGQPWRTAMWNLVRRDYSPRPAATAYATLIKLLDGATFTSLTSHGDAMVSEYRFSKREGDVCSDVYAVYLKDRTERILSFTFTDPISVRQITMDGVPTDLSPVSGSYFVTAGAAPVYVVVRVQCP